ncbi:MAG: Mur ligase family protein, partial [Acidaminococcus sp.]|nr:Mur ligase family protein [Acidaminococcus sp.]
MERKLKEVLCQLPGAVVTGKVNDQVIRDLTIDSRTVAPGSLFICLKGVNTDGHKYIGKAVEQGAAAILVEEDVAPIDGTVFIKVPSTNEAMTGLAPWFYDYPARKMRMVGVTGTNGKTTTTNILRTLLTRTGHKVGLIGTINVMIGDEVRKSHNTTPDVVDLQKILYEMVEAHCDTCVMEVSSHALALRRVAGIEYDTA